MRLRAFCLTAAVLVSGTALAQAPKSAKAPAGPEMRYFTAIEGLMDGNADIVLKEQRQGKTIQSATFDVCYPIDSTTDRHDRFVVTLTPAGGALTGSTTSQVNKQPVTVQLTQKASGDGFDFKGQMTIGTSTVDIASNDNADMSEREFQDIQSTDDGIVPNPKDFTEVSPEAISVKVRVDQATDFLKALRGQAVEILPSSLVVSCEALRSGSMVMSLTVDPARASVFVVNARSMPGVITAGWGSGLSDMERTVRFPAAEWRDGERVNRDKVAAALSDVLAPAFQAKFDSAKWLEPSGKLRLTFKRPQAGLPGLGLTERLDVDALVAPERPGATDRLIVWVGSASVTTLDESETGKLIFADATNADEEGDARADGGLMDRLAKQFKGQRWDSDASNWKQP